MVTWRMCLEAVTESGECLPPDEGLGVFNDSLVQELVHGGGRGEGLHVDELLEETGGLQPALVKLPAQLLPLLHGGVQTDPDIHAVPVGERLSPHLPAQAVDWITTRPGLQSEVVEPPLSHEVVDQVLLLLHRVLADLADLEVCVGRT